MFLFSFAAGYRVSFFFFFFFSDHMFYLFLLSRPPLSLTGIVSFDRLMVWETCTPSFLMLYIRECLCTIFHFSTMEEPAFIFLSSLEVIYFINRCR